MKKLKLLAVIMLLGAIGFAQKGPYIGGHYAFNNTWLMNKYVFDAGAEMDHEVSFGSFYGFIFGFNFTDETGLEINLNRNVINQKYKGEFGSKYLSDTRITATEVPILLKYGYKSYFELGPVLQFLNGATYNRAFENPLTSSLSDENNKNVLDAFNTTNFGVIFGFGGSINLIDYKLKLDIGFRIQYIITDMEGIDALGYEKNDIASNLDRVNFHTNALIGGFRLALNYYFE